MPCSLDAFLSRGRELLGRPHDLACVLEEKPRAEQQCDDDQHHHDEEEEVFEVLGVVGVIGNELSDLTEIARVAFAALAAAVDAHAAIHALAGTVLYISSEYLDISAVELFAITLGCPYQLNKARVTRNIPREFDFLAFHITFCSSTREISSLSFLECCVVEGQKNFKV